MKDLGDAPLAGPVDPDDPSKGTMNADTPVRIGSISKVRRRASPAAKGLDLRYHRSLMR
jgi:hypothetical protein